MGQSLLDSNFQMSETLTGASAYSYIIRGTARLAEGRREEGIADLTQAKQLEPDNPESYWNLGIVYAEDSPQKALNEYQTAARLFQQAGDKTMVDAAQREIKRIEERLSDD